MYLKKRGNTFHFRKRVPKEFQSFFTKTDIQVPLNTDSEKAAQQRALCFNRLLDDFWYDLAVSGTDKAQNKYKKMLLHAKMCGFQYVPMKKITKESSATNFIGRVDLASKMPEPIAKSILGSTKRSALNLSKVLEIFITHERGNLTSHSDNQIRKWENPRKKAFKNLIAVVEDKDLHSLTREDILKFRQWWIDKIQKENKTANSANKDFNHLQKGISIAADNMGINVPVESLFKKIRLTEVQKKRRYPFETSFIQNTLLASDLANLDEECRLFIYAMSDTGARISELVGLEYDNGDINLDALIPHIKIRPNNTRNLKTPQSERDLPLVGASLFAFQKLEIGFSQYHGKADHISNTINRICRRDGIFPSAHHSLYSLRHSFEDRLTAIEPPDKVQAELMGHKYHRPRYGHGASLEQKKLWLEKIAFKVG